jgi:hypothetical protein
VPDALAPAEIPCEMNSFKTSSSVGPRARRRPPRSCSGPSFARHPLKVKIECVFHLTNNFAYLFLVVLAHAPAAQHAPAPADMQRPELLLLDVPLFLSTCGSICVFYLVTQKALYGGL